MTSSKKLFDETPSKLAENIVLFTRLLRATGMRLGTASAIDATKAATVIELANKRFFFHALQATLVKRPEDNTLFEQAFILFWQNPKFQERIRNLLIPQINKPEQNEQSNEEILRRLQDALGNKPPKPMDDDIDKIEIDASTTASERAYLKNKDFQMMSTEEIRDAVIAIQALKLKMPQRLTYRFAPDTLGRKINIRHSLRQARKSTGLVIPKRGKRKQEDRAIVILLDISGSMESYTRIMLHFIHALSQQHTHVQSFIFGTKLTNITNHLKNKDIDLSLQEVSKAAEDWSGGTRIKDSIEEFNQTWSRRVLSGSPYVLLITDGLEQNHDVNLASVVKKLQMCSKRLLWLNPLLRFKEFSPKSTSIKQIIANVDAFLPIHSLTSINELVTIIASPKLHNDNHISNWKREARKY